MIGVHEHSVNLLGICHTTSHVQTAFYVRCIAKVIKAVDKFKQSYFHTCFALMRYSPQCLLSNFIEKYIGKKEGFLEI